jgi:VIT1/CCC1 family predicted Fe2+/Mn2+ transporter
VRHREWHRTDRIGWLRAAVLGANDGIVSTASLVLGVAAANGTHSTVMAAARVGGAPVTTGAMRVTFWGALAMGLTAGVGAVFGTVA